MIILRRFSIFLIAFGMLWFPLMVGGRLFGPFIAYPSWIIVAGMGLYLLSLCGNLARLDLRHVPHWPWLLPYLAVSLWIALQLLILPGLVGNAFGVERFVSPFNPEWVVEPNPVNWYVSIHFWGLFSIYWAVAYMAFSLNRIEAKWFFYFLAACGLFQLIYGVFFSRTATEVLGIFIKERFQGVVTGTYGHPNHYSGYLVLMMPVVVAAALFFVRRQKNKLIRFSIYLLAFCLFAFASLMILRSGVRISMAACVVSWALFFWLMLKHKFKVGFWWRLGIVLGVGAISVLLFIVENQTYINYQIYRLQVAGARLGLWENVLKLPEHIWIWGGGAGTFGDVYVIAADAVITAIRPYEEAHNDYLQFVVEFGVVGSIIIALAGIVWLFKLWPKEMSWMKIGAVCGIVAILVRLTVDFDLQLPGTAIYFWALVGVLLNPNVVDMSRKRKRKRRSLSRKDKKSEAFAEIYEDT